MSLYAQTPSPSNFPHAYGGLTTTQYGPSLSSTYHGMGMNGHVIYTGGDTRMVFNKSWDTYMTWSAQQYGPNAIQKNSRIWISTNMDSRVCVLDTMATVLHQLSITGTVLVQLIADTSNHIYLVYRDQNVFNGFGVIRYGASFVPEWHYFYPGANPLEAQWGIDQRLYVTCNGRVVVLDANGNRLKDLLGVGQNYTVYQDHGLGIVSFLADSVSVIRTDSNMALRWAKRFAPDTQMLGQPLTVIAAAGVAAPGSNDMVIPVTCQVQIPSPSVCTYPNTDELYTVLLDANGTVQAVQNGQGQYNKLQYSVRSSPYGDPLISYGIHSCLLSAHVETRMLRMMPGYDIREACSGIPPATTSQNFIPSTLPSLGTLGTRTAGAVAIGPDNTSFGVFRYNVPVTAGSTTCVKPCLNVGATPLGGGQVAFSDEVYGYYKIRYDFGDGSTGTTNDPVHTYPPYGSYPVTVVATNACGADTFSFTVHACTTAQVSGPSGICLGSSGPATFTETSGLPPANLTWLLNGVAVGSGSSFTWTPTLPGTYTLSTVYADLPCRDTNTRTVVVSSAPPVAGFTFAVTGQRQLTFSNTSTGATTYQWSFGDGGTSTVPHPVQTYSTYWANNGNFTICLIATNPCGSDTSCFTFNCPIPYASFSIPSTNRLTASITSAALNGTLTWDFGDGSTTTGPVSSHTFPAPGTYTICQTVSNACASHSVCQTALVDQNGTSAYREHFSSGYDQFVHAIAAQPNGDVLVALANPSANGGLLPLDSTGAVRGPMNVWTGNNYEMNELHPQANGNFAFFGETFNTGTGIDPFWGEVDKLGNILQAQTVPMGTINQFGRRAYKLPSGYLYILQETIGATNYYYIKFDLNLQIQYFRSTSARLFGGLEAPDGSIWLVQQPNNLNANLEFVHLNASGVGTEKYTTSFPIASSTTYIANDYWDLGMDCDGNLYGMFTVHATYPVPGGSWRLGLARFNTLSHDAETRLYRVGAGGSANAPLYTPVVTTLVQYPNGHWMGWGNLARASGPVQAPGYEKLLVDLDPSTFSLSFSAFGEPGSASHHEQVMDACVSASGQCYTASRTGLLSKPVEVHRHYTPTDCQLPPSALAPTAVIELSNTTVAYSNTPVPSTAFSTLPNSWARIPSTTTANSLLQCSGTCPSSLSASFTYAVTGNTVTLTSTSTPGAMLAWSIAGQSCLANGGSGNATATTLTVNLPCGNHTVTLSASDQCGTSSITQNILINSASPVSIGPDLLICPGSVATLTATPSFSSYQWSTGATTASISVGTPGTYHVTVTDTGGCTSADTVILGNHAPSVSVGPDQAVCVGSPATFSATSGMSSYLWSTGATSNSITVSAPGTYTVTATDANGCTASDTATLGNFPTPSFSLGTDTSFCVDTTWTLAGPGGANSYLWSTGATTQNIAADTTGIYSLLITDANGCTASDTIQLILSLDCVWPGDANHDGIADNSDLLALAYGMGASGPVRANANLSWYGQPAADWGISLPLGANFKHLDCDGNGTLQLADTAAITLNYGLIHNKTGGMLGGIPAWIEPELDSFPVGDTVFFLVHWGDAGLPVNLGHGIAFTLQIAPAHVTPGTLYGRFPNSFLGNGVPELATMTIPFAGSGDVAVAISRQDQIGRSGHGAVMRVGFLPDQVLPLTATLGYVPVNITGIVAVDGDFAPLLCSGQGDSILIFDPVNSTVPSQGLFSSSLFPVPTSDLAYLDVRLAHDAAVAVELTDLHGRVLTALQSPTTMRAGHHRISIPTDQLSDGVYLVRLVVGKQSKVMKLVVAK